MVAAAEPLLAEHDVVVVEGLVPGSGLVYAGRTNIALANALDADVLLVGAPSEATPATTDPRRRPDDARLAETIGITARTYRAGERDRVIGAVVNRVPDTSPAAVERIRGALAGQQLALVGAVPLRPELRLAAGLRRRRRARRRRCSTPATPTGGSRTSSWPRRPCPGSCRCCARAPW